MKRLHLSLIYLLLLSLNWPADASVPLGNNRKGVNGKYDMYGCMQSNDYYVVNFAAYQLDSTQHTKKTLPQAECINIPMTGETQISIDLLDMDVRKKPVALQIVDESGQSIAEIPSAIAKHGVLTTSVNFKGAGKYRAILSVNDSDLHTPPTISALHIPLSVALGVEQASSSGEGLLIILLLTALSIVALAYYIPRLLKPAKTALAD